MPLNEADTRAQLIDPQLKAAGWSDNALRATVTQEDLERLNATHDLILEEVDRIIRIR